MFLLLILAVAGFFRLWQLGSIPPGLWPDEAAYAQDAIETLKTGDFKVFYAANQGREGLFMWILAAVFSVFGISIWTFKIVPATIGVLTVLGTYLLTNELFAKLKIENSKGIALLSSFFVAISFWAVNFSRIGFRANLLPLLLVFAFYFLFRAFRSKRFSNFTISGLIFGLGFYSYISFRLAVLVLSFALLFWVLVSARENWLRKYIAGTALLLLAVFIIALPLEIYFLENPENFASRALGVSVFEQEQPVKSFFQSLVKHLAMFNFSGDRNWRHNLSGFPQLSPLTGIFFLVGIIFAIRRIFAGNTKERGIYLFLFVWFFSLLLPGALTVEGIPHALRTIGVIPAAYIFAGLGAWLAYEWGKNKFGNIKVVSFSLLTLMAVFSFIMYFEVWAKSPELKSAFPLEFNQWLYQIEQQM